MTSMQLIANIPDMVDKKGKLIVGSIENVTEEEIASDFLDMYNGMGFERYSLFTRDGYALIVYYHKWSGWRIIVTDVII